MRSGRGLGLSIEAPLEWVLDWVLNAVVTSLMTGAGTPLFVVEGISFLKVRLQLGQLLHDGGDLLVRFPIKFDLPFLGISKDGEHEDWRHSNENRRE